MPRLRLAHLLVLLGPAALLGGALVSQHFFGLPPCEMCMWQRWPHVAALVLGSAALFAAGATRGIFILLAALAIAASGAIGVFHAGVEYGFWEGVTSCAVQDIGSGGDFMRDIMAAPLVRCDVAPWELFGVSLAGYNAILSFLIAGGALWLLSRTRPMTSSSR